jgi:hypothetical protein
VLRHDPNVCSLTGQGFENLAIVPRPEAAGWRMFVAGGSFACYDFQIFSATSVDERTWTLEPGIRVGNESDSAMTNPFATGEGIVVDPLPSGGWRMVTGAWGRVPSQSGRFQILEWNSPDQITWTYTRPVLTTLEMPLQPGERVQPHHSTGRSRLWRMVFTGDDGEPERRLLVGAVSTDRTTWQVEGCCWARHDQLLLRDRNRPVFHPQRRRRTASAGSDHRCLNPTKERPPFEGPFHYRLYVYASMRLAYYWQTGHLQAMPRLPVQ